MQYCPWGGLGTGSHDSASGSKNCPGGIHIHEHRQEQANKSGSGMSQTEVSNSLLLLQHSEKMLHLMVHAYLEMNRRNQTLRNPPFQQECKLYPETQHRVTVTSFEFNDYKYCCSPY